MRTETTLRALVFAVPGDAEAPWRAARTTRALARLGVASGVSSGAVATAEALAQAEGPTWLLRAGAVPLAMPRVPPPSATGRALLAFGATAGDPAWAALLSSTGGDLSQVKALPEVLSVFAEAPRALADALAARANGAASGDAEDALAQACMHASKAERRTVWVPCFDVTYAEKSHVALLVTTLHRGGAERVVLDLRRELAALGLDVTLAVLDRASRTTYEAPEDTVFLDELAQDRSARLAALGDLAIERGVDLIHAHLVNGEDLKLLARSDVPLVTTIHNSRPGWPVKLEALVAGELALTIACSRDVERQLLEARLPGPTRTIWNGIERGPVSAERGHARGARSAEEMRVRMLAIANHRPQKRLERLPTVVAELRARGYDASVRIVGEPVKNDPTMAAIAGRIGERAERLGIGDAVVLEGARSDVRALYAACDAVVSASAFEGLSLVHLEALAAGVPLVTTAVAGTEELTRKHAHAHALPLDASPSVFADAVLAAVAAANAANAASPSSPALGLAPDFTSAKMAERHAELFSRVLSSPPRARAPRTSSSSRGLVLVANNFSTGGAQSSARRLLLALAGAGVPVRAVVLQEQAAFPTPGRAALTAAGIDVLVAPRAGDVDPLITARAIARDVDARGAGALLFWNVISQHKVLIADLLLDATLWDVSPGEMYFSSFERYLQRPRVGSPYLSMTDYGRRLAGVIVKYEGERARAEDALGARVEVVPNGVVVPELPGVRPHPFASAARGQRVIVGTLARLGVDKKLEQLIEAMAHAAKRGLLGACELRIAGGVEPGDEAYVEALRERSRGLPITWVGEQPSASFLAELDLFAMISEPSGCPNASLEAMAAGLAVVATDVGGAREQIVHGETGLLVPRGDSPALGEVLAELAGDPERRLAMGLAGHARAAARFGVERMAADYARICLGVSLATPAKRPRPAPARSSQSEDPGAHAV